MKCTAVKLWVGSTLVILAMRALASAQGGAVVRQSPIRLGQLAATLTEYRSVSVPGAHHGIRFHLEMAALQVRNVSKYPNCTSVAAALTYQDGGDAVLYYPPNRGRLGPQESGLLPGQGSKGSYFFEVENGRRPVALVLGRDTFGERACAEKMDQPIDLSGGDRIAISLVPRNEMARSQPGPADEGELSDIVHPSNLNKGGAVARLGQLEISALGVRQGLRLKGGGSTITPRKGYHFQVVNLAIQNVSAYPNCTKLEASLGLPEEGAELGYNFDSASANAPPGSRLTISYVFLVHHTVQPSLFTLRLARYIPGRLVDGTTGCTPLSDVSLGSATVSFQLDTYERGMEDTLDINSVPGMAP